MYILAEAAQGYEGSIEKAVLLSKAASQAGADGIKFQVIYADEICTPSYEHYDLFRSLEMPEENWKAIVAHASNLGLEVFFDVFGNQSLSLAKNLAVKNIKIHSTCFFDEALFNSANEFADTILLSIGGILPEELEEVLPTRISRAKSQLVIMYGFQAEPTPLDKNNLARIPLLADRFKLPVGFMDHSVGEGLQAFTLSSLALGLGVRFFEKHITIERALELEDYVSALGPTDFGRFTENLQLLHDAMGHPTLALTVEEETYRTKALKTVVCAMDVKAGQALDQDMITMKRTSPSRVGALYRVRDVLGRKIQYDLVQGAQITLNDIV